MTKDDLLDLIDAQHRVMRQAVADAWPAPVPQPTPTPVPQPTAIDPADIVISARADKPFSQQSKWAATAMGKSSRVQNMAEAGFMDRITKVADPTDASKQVLSFLLNPTDPDTSGAPRTELSCDRNIAAEKVYWCGFSAYYYGWGSEFKAGLYGFQLHTQVSGESPPTGIYVADASNFEIQTRYQGSKTTRHGKRPIKFNAWQDFVIKARLSMSNGLLQVWEDGVQIVNYTGKLAYASDQPYFFKFGIYQWGGLTVPRRLLLRNPTVILDATGEKYTAEQVRSHVNQ